MTLRAQRTAVGLESEPAPMRAVTGERAGARNFLAGRTPRNGASAARALAAGRAQHAAMVGARTALIQADPRVQAFGAAWQPLGPSAIQSASYGTVSGRITSVAVDPGDLSGNTVYVGSAGGGVWKSTNAMSPADAVSFTPLTDTLPVFSANAGSAATPSLSIGALTAVPGGLVLAGTGDPNDATDSYYGGGILRSVDGGVTWTVIDLANDGVNGFHSFVGLGFAGFAWSTVTPSLMVASLSQSAEGVLVDAPDPNTSVMGLYVSNDAGATWRMATIQDGTQTVQRPLLRGGNNGGRAATAVVWNPVRQRFYAAVRFHGYYESSDGQTWTRLLNQPGAGLTTAACPTAPNLPGSTACPIFRGALAVDPVSGDMFALTVDSHNHDTGLFRDVCGRSGGGCQNSAPTFANGIASAAIESTDGSGTVVEGDYNLALAAVPSGADTILFVGTQDVFRCSVAGGCVLRNTTNTRNGCHAPALVAPAQHAIGVAAAGAPPGVFFGNDGGLWRSTDLVNQQASVCSGDDAAHFANLNGGLGSLAGVASLAGDPSIPGVLMAGLGAEGTVSTGGAGWSQISAGEGGSVAIDPVNPALWYFSTAAGISIDLCARGAGCSASDGMAPAVIGPASVATDDALLDAPWLLDPNDTSQLIAGTCRVWRGPASGGGVWPTRTALSPMLSGPQGARCDVLHNGLIRSLAAGAPRSANDATPVLYAGMAGALSGGGTAAGHVFTNGGTAAAGAPGVWVDLGTNPVTNDTANRNRFNPQGFDISSVAIDPHDATGGTVYATVLGFGNAGLALPHVYRSVDGGAHWLDISSNLPAVPANSVAVDPNDANTVYVAMDTGVYATATVNTCTAANCWTVYGTGLPNAPAVRLAVAADLPTGDGRRGELRVGTAGRGIWQVPLLTAHTDLQPAMTLSTAALVFGSQAANTLSAAQTVVVTNTGTAPLAVSGVSATGDFSATTNCAGAPVAVGGSCVVQVVFLPTATGLRTGSLTISANVLGGQAGVALSGTATTPPSVVLSPAVLPFPLTTVGAPSAAENILIANTGGAGSTLGVPVVSGDFTIAANTCGRSIPAGTGCTVSVVFTPRASGARTGLLQVTTGSGTLTAALSGTAVAPPTDSLSADALVFGPEATGFASAGQTLVMTNSGDQSLTLINAVIASGDFTVVNGCGNSLAGHAACAISVFFTPSRLGAQTGSLAVSDAFRSQTVALSGTGIAPPGVSVSPTRGLNFGATPVHTSAVQTATLTNNGGPALTLAGVTLTGDFALGAGSTCGGTVPAFSSCDLRVVFTPSVTGLRFGTLTIADSSPGSPHIVSLTGSGLDFAAGADGQTSATITSGQSAVFPLLVSSEAGVAGTAAVTCMGMPANSTCVVSPASVALGAGGSTLVVATLHSGVQSGSAGLRVPKTGARTSRAWGGDERALWCALLVPVALLLPGARRRVGRWPVLLLLPVLFGGLSGCSLGRTIPPASLSGGGGSAAVAVTPPGTYTIAVTVASGGLSREVDFTLIVH